MDRKVIFYFIAGLALLLGFIDLAKTGERYFLSYMILLLASIHIIYNFESYKKTTVSSFGKTIFFIGVIGFVCHFFEVIGFVSQTHLFINLVNIIIGCYLWKFVYVDKDRLKEKRN